MSTTSTPVRAEIATDRYRTTITARSHTFIADEPGPLGGTDLGPSPHDLLLASLAACKAITARMYADRKAWPLETLSVDAALADAPGDASHDRARILCTVRMTGPLTDEQRQRILAITEKCPVHKTLAAGAVIETSITDA